MSSKTRINYLLDAVIALAFIMSAVSGLVLWLGDVGGYQGGHNPVYRVWNDLHIWTSLVMMAGVGLHLVLHWRWIVSVSKGLLSASRQPTQEPLPTA